MPGCKQQQSADVCSEHVVVQVTLPGRVHGLDRHLEALQYCIDQPCIGAEQVCQFVQARVQVRAGEAAIVVDRPGIVIQQAQQVLLQRVVCADLGHQCIQAGELEQAFAGGVRAVEEPYLEGRDVQQVGAVYGVACRCPRRG
ncbi:hypothetical protein D9M71_313400 [compost metagenome]